MISKAVAGGALCLGVVFVGPDASTRYGNQGIEEDQVGWSCATMGNRVCGPANVEGAVAGCYDAGGVLVIEWPCVQREEK